MKQLETELVAVRERVKVLENQLKAVNSKKAKVNSSVSRLSDSVVELKQNFNSFHGSVQDRLKVIYEQLKK